MKKLFLLLMLPLMAHAWEPTKPIEAFSPFTVGSANDISLRITSLEVERNTKATIVVNVKPGAGGSLVNDFINKQKPDGYTVSASSIPALGATDKIMLPNKDFSAKDFTYALNIASIPMTIVALPNDPVNDINGLTKVLKTEKTTIGDPGAAARIVYEMAHQHIGFVEGTSGIVRVEYKGPADTLNDVMGGHIRFGIMPLTVSIQAHKAGKIKIIAVTSAQPIKFIPEVKTASSLYPDFVFNLEVVLTLPPNTPKEIVDWYVAEYNKALVTPSVVDQLENNMMFVNKRLLNSKDTTNYIIQYEKKFTPIVNKVLGK
jgi:tripartite-type tricarboxylate transporter receptor subunit TctC